MTSGNINRSLGLSALVIMSIAGLALTGSVAARADIQPVDEVPSMSGAPNSDTFFTWNIEVTSTENVVAGQYFTFYDVAGFVYDPSDLTGAAAVPAGWEESVNFSAPDAQGTSTKAGPDTNDASLADVTFTYEGGTGLPTAINGEISLGTFTLESVDSGVSSKSSTMAGIANHDLPANPPPGSTVNVDANTANYYGPGGSPTGHGTPVLPTPEPGVFVTAASMLSMTGIGLVRGRRRAKAVKIAA